MLKINVMITNKSKLKQTVKTVLRAIFDGDVGSVVCC